MSPIIEVTEEEKDFVKELRKLTKALFEEEEGKCEYGYKNCDCCNTPIPEDEQLYRAITELLPDYYVDSEVVLSMYARRFPHTYKEIFEKIGKPLIL